MGENESKEGAPTRTPALAEADAARRLSHGFRGRLAESIDSTGKALALLAGLGAFFIAAGYFVEWQRLRQGRLPAEQVLPLMQKDQIAAAGARELAISILFVALSLAVLGFVLVRLAHWTRGGSGRTARLLGNMLSRDIAFPTAIVGGLTLLTVPFGTFGVIVAFIVTGLFLYGMLLIRRFLREGDDALFPLWRLVIAVGLAAIILAGARQFEFPERRPDAVVCLRDGTEVAGDYIASDSEKVLLRRRLLLDEELAIRRHAEFVHKEATRGKTRARRKELRQEERRIARNFRRRSHRRRHDGLRCAGLLDPGSRKNVARRTIRKRPRLIIVRMSDVEEILIARSGAPLPSENSLLGEIAADIPWMPKIEFACIPPECRAGEKTRIGPSTFL